MTIETTEEHKQEMISVEGVQILNLTMKSLLVETKWYLRDVDLDLERCIS